VIKFVSDLGQVGGFIRVLSLPPPMKLTARFLNGSYLHVCYFCENKNIDINILGWGEGRGSRNSVPHMCLSISNLFNGGRT
jgi:hypothetical protein